MKYGPNCTIHAAVCSHRPLFDAFLYTVIFRASEVPTSYVEHYLQYCN